MAAVDRYDAALGIFISRYVRNNIHTNIRGRVVSVNYGGPSVDVQPLPSTTFPGGAVDQYPVIYDVPLSLPSGSGGKSRLSMPIKPGDIVGLTFSERNEDDNEDVNTHQLFPGWAVSQIFTDNNSKPIDPDNVVLENDLGIVTLYPDGKVTIKNPGVDITANPDGNIYANGARITPDGNVITKNGVNLDDFWEDYLSHRHSGVETGGGTTGTKV